MKLSYAVFMAAVAAVHAAEPEQNPGKLPPGPSSTEVVDRADEDNGFDDNVLWKSGHFQGDIAANFDDVVKEFGELVGEEAAADGELDTTEVAPAKRKPKGSGGLRGLGATTSDNSILWPNGKLYWVWTWDTYNNVEARNAITAAHNYINQKTEIELVYGKGNGDYVSIEPLDGCWSSVGRKGGKQSMSIGEGCEHKGIVIHEMFHALGAWHEQSSKDRDDFVKINYGNIEEGKEHNFAIKQSTTSYGFDFDYGSIMQYGEYAFSRNGQKTIDCRGKMCGQRAEMSDSDIKSLNVLYGKASYSNDGTACARATTCKSCKNEATYWNSRLSYACGKEKCFLKGRLCHSTAHCRANCCRGYTSPWFSLGFGWCK